MEKWNELCFILSESIPFNASEQVFEMKVIQAFEKLGWSHFKGEISVRENIQLGASNRIMPDIIIKSANTNLFVVEVKNPAANLKNPSYQNQLSSYMRMLRLNFGILIGNEIKIFVDGSLVDSNQSELVESISFKKDNPQGLQFINLFQKDTFSYENVENYIQNKIQTIKENKYVEKIRKEITTTEYSDYLISQLKNKLLNEYSEKIVDRVLEDFKVKIYDSRKTEIQRPIYVPSAHYVPENNNGSTNEIELAKIFKKVPVWFNKPDQKNSQILITFMKLREQKTPVTFFELEKACERIPNFRNSYQAMKTISKKNNAKVFDEVGRIISLWEPGRSFVEKEYERYLRRNSE
tara:strand:+ start:32699 stop:33751 length:1053 start_codon:yes stop_codon:yes gene_type:complete